MKRNYVFFITLILFLVSGAPVWGSYKTLQTEPPLNTQMGWDLKPNGLLYVSYDLDHNNKADFYTVRSIHRSYVSDQSVRTIARTYPGYPVFYVPYGNDHYFYITSPSPLFYAFDFNEDGNWDLMYKDVLEDGVNGNEQFYESPSKMFAELDLKERAVGGPHFK